MEKLPLETQTLYAELLEQLEILEAHRSIGSLSGCFTTKEIKGEDYYYFQYSGPGGQSKQIYIGKKTPTLEKVADRFLKEREEIKTDKGSLQRLCAQLRAGGSFVMDAASARVLKGFAESGVFHLNGVLVGTHAFTTLGSLLGVRWEHAGIRTQDIDIAGHPILHIALPQMKANIPQILESLEMGFLPVPPMNPKNPSTSFKVRGSPLRVDIFTPSFKEEETKPIPIKRFNVAAQPMPFLDNLMEKTERAAVIDGGGILVNVPNPAFFAMHKLIVMKERSAAFHSKVEKDLLQASQLFSILSEERAGDLLLAWEALEKRGKGWVQKVKAGFQVLQKKYPESFSQLKKVLNP